MVNWLMQLHRWVEQHQLRGKGGHWRQELCHPNIPCFQLQCSRLHENQNASKRHDAWLYQGKQACGEQMERGEHLQS
jgi:hypothetical protein